MYTKFALYMALVSVCMCTGLSVHTQINVAAYQAWRLISLRPTLALLPDYPHRGHYQESAHVPGVRTFSLGGCHGYGAKTVKTINWDEV